MENHCKNYSVVFYFKVIAETKYVNVHKLYIMSSNV